MPSSSHREACRQVSRLSVVDRGFTSTMPIVEELIELRGSKGSRQIVALIDSGSTHSCIWPDIAREVPL
jgi:hypothetical protein